MQKLRSLIETRLKRVTTEVSTAHTDDWQRSFELRRRGPEAQSALLKLLGDERGEVRSWAATHAPEFAPDRAEVVLGEIASGPESLEQFEARLVLEEWRAGRLRFP